MPLVRVSKEANLASHELSRASPFSVHGAQNVFLETIKRGEDDNLNDEKKRTIILRLYEQFGGHARATVRM